MHSRTAMLVASVAVLLGAGACRQLLGDNDWGVASDAGPIDGGMESSASTGAGSSGTGSGSGSATGASSGSENSGSSGSGSPGSSDAASEAAGLDGGASSRCANSGASAECNPVQPSACPPAQPLCAFNDAGAHCFSAGSGTQGAPCPCAPGYTCNGPSVNAGQCYKFCQVQGNDCPPQFWCGPFSAALCYGAQEIGGCTQQCNPVVPSVSDSLHQACGPAQQCDLEFDSQGHTVCFAATGNSTQGMPCNTPPDCAPGFECVGMLCKQFCRVGAGFADCTKGTCTSFSPKAFDRTQEIGFCQ